MKTTVTSAKIAPRNWGEDPRYLYIGRPSIWGNPYSHLLGSQAKFHVPTVEEAVAKHKQDILANPELLRQLPKLAGKILVCYCVTKRNPNAPCHGHFLAFAADYAAQAVRLFGEAEFQANPLHHLQLAYKQGRIV